MLKRAATSCAALVFAAAVLITSILRGAAPSYVFSKTTAEATAGGFIADVGYYLPYPGILPDHFLWPLKAARDKAWLFLTRDSMKRAQLNLLFADKRVGMARELVRGGKSELGVSIAARSGQYLDASWNEVEKAEQKGVDTASFLTTLAKASLKHREVLEETMTMAPDEARPMLNQSADYARLVYEKAVGKLIKEGRPIPVPNMAEFE